MLDYNVPGGKLNRGMAVLDVLQALKGDQVRLFKGLASAMCCRTMAATHASGAGSDGVS
jgi:ATP-dependent protease ClpP protease subunit